MSNAKRRAEVATELDRLREIRKTAEARIQKLNNEIIATWGPTRALEDEQAILEMQDRLAK